VVTLEDILEQIVGEIHDEHERAPASAERLPDGSYRVAARTNIDELNEAFDWTLPKQDYETVAGLVLATLGRVPARARCSRSRATRSRCWRPTPGA